MNLNNIGIGVDVELISRFKKLDVKKNNKFLCHIFTKNEISYCFSKKIFTQHLAARFAGKEAIIKAIYALKKTPPALNKINIINDSTGIPTVHLKGYNIKISLAHTKNTAIAFAMVEKK